MANESTTGSKYAIVRKIKAMLNLGDEGKLDSFFRKAEKALTTAIKAEEQELKVLEFQFNQDHDKLKDDLADAQAAYEESFANVKVEKIETNSQQTDYVQSYFRQIDEKEQVVKRVEEKIKSLIEAFDKEKADNAARIDVLKARKARITA